MTKNTRFSPEVRQRAVRMVLESQAEYDSQWAASCSIAPKIGCTPETLLPLFCRIRITPGNHRKHLPEAHRCNRPGDSVDGYFSGPGCTRTRPPGASVNRRYGHHGHRPTAGQFLFYHCPAPGPERGYHPHGLYRASAYTGAGRHTAAPAVQQQHLSSAPMWHGSAPRPDDGISLTGGITADGLHIFQRQYGPEAPLRHNCVQWVLKAPVPARYGRTDNRPVSDVVFR